MALRRVYVFSRQPVPSVGERFVGVRGVAISFRSPLGGGIYGVALLAALITSSDTPTVGASGVVFASVGFRLNRCRSLKTWGVVLLSVAVGALFSQINAALHGVALLGGWLVALVYHFFIRWADDYRSTFG